MANSINVLVTSASRKAPLIHCLKQSMQSLGIEGKVIGGDANKLCIARYFVDEFWQMPVQELLTIEELLLTCLNFNIKAIIPTRDGELPFFAEHRDLLGSKGIHCLVPNKDAVEICRNKILFYKTLAEHNFPVIPSFKHPEGGHCLSYVVKECFGSGSRAIGLDLSLSRAKEWAKRMNTPIFQPFIRGVEYSVDLYIDKIGGQKGAIARRRDLIVDGESQITTSERFPQAEETCLKAASLLGIYGHAVFQLIVDLSGHLHIIECNPRFGGASTLSAAMGLKSFEWFLQEAQGLPISQFTRLKHELRQVRYLQDKLFEANPTFPVHERSEEG